MDNTLHFDYTSLVPSQHPASFTAPKNEEFRRNYEFANIRAPLIDPNIAYEQELSSFRHDEYPGAPSYSLGPGPPLDQQRSIGTSYWSRAKFGQEAAVEFQVHAPIPVSGCAPILRDDALQTDDPSTTGRFMNPYITAQYQADYQAPEMQRCQFNSISSPPSAVISQPTFLTPSELLVELSGQTNQPGQTLQQNRQLGRVLGKDPQSRSPKPARPTFKTATAPSSLFTSALNESQHSESITSHEKKRHYLECLEQYIAFLHDHFRRVGIEPAPLERISNYRCLNSRSIRSLLIHMEKTTRRMQERIFREEQKFLYLREAVQRQECVMEAGQGVQL